MLIHLSALVFSFLLLNGNSPNYYPNYAAAREASRKTKKELVVFFSENSCATCESAWSAFTKDPAAAEKYVCTRLDIKDFDGGVFFNHFQFKKVPAWAMLTPGALVEETWEGGWKDAKGNPTLYDLNIAQTTLKEEEKIATTSPSSSVPAPKEMPSPTQTASNESSVSIVSETKTPSNPEIKSSIPKENFSAIVSETKSQPPSETKPKGQSTGFVLQAGYFGSKTNADKMMNNLKTKGFSDFKIEPVQKDASTFYRVITKIYYSESDVNTEQKYLSEIGINTAVKQL